MTLNDSSTDKAKLSISQRLGTLYAVVQGLETEGVSVTTAQASKSSGDYVLVFAHDLDVFARWMKARNLTPEFMELPDSPGELRWSIGTEFLGINVTGYLTDEEKELWDNEIYPRDPA